jgi:hypothetical protein
MEAVDRFTLGGLTGAWVDDGRSVVKFGAKRAVVVSARLKDTDECRRVSESLSSKVKSMVVYLPASMEVG